MSILFSSNTYAASEIRVFAAGTTTAYSIIREPDGDVYYIAGDTFEAFGTGGRTMADYDIALVDKSADMFVGDFDTDIAAGTYYILSFQQEGGTPANDDPAIFQEYGKWDGTSVWSPGVTDDVAEAVWDELVADHTGETTFGGELGTLDPNITLILADTSAYDTDAEHAAAIWNALMATYTVEASFGEEVQQLDPNITLILADTDEIQTELADGGRTDLLIDAIKAVTDILEIVSTTVSNANDANSFTLTAGKATTDAYLGNTIYVQDADDGEWESRMIISWTSARVVVTDEDFSFTPANGDVVVIWHDYFPMRAYWEIPKHEPDDPIIIDYRVLMGTPGGTRTLDATSDDP